MAIEYVIDTKKILEKQLSLLSQCAQECSHSASDLANLTHAMCEIAVKLEIPCVSLMGMGKGWSASITSGSTRKSCPPCGNMGSGKKEGEEF